MRRLFPTLAFFACSLAFSVEKPTGPFSYDLYERLGVAKNAADNDIKKVYRKLTRQYHPDLGGDPEAFKFITAAYDVLRDPVKRESYDRYGLSAPEFDNLRSNWETATGLTAPRAERQASSSTPDYRARESFDERRAKSMRYVDELHDYFEKRHAGLIAATDADTEHLLLNLFSPLKFDLKAMTEHPRFRDTMGLILNDSVWNISDPNPLLRAFIREEWFRYTLDFQREKLGAFFGKLDPSNPTLQEVIYSTHRFSPKIRDQREFLDSIGLVMASMLREDHYRGTRAGEKLLNQAYEVWNSLGQDVIGRAGRDSMTPKLLSLLDLPEWRKNRTLARIAQTPPASYHHDLIDEYDKLREKYPDIFPTPTKEELRAKANHRIDLLDNTFKCRIAGLVNCGDERTQKELIEVFKNTRAKDLEMMTTLSPYHFHDMFNLMLADPIWDKADPELFKSFLDGEWFRTLRPSKKQKLEAFLEKHKANNAVVQEFIRTLDSKPPTEPVREAQAPAPAAEPPPSKPGECIQTEMFNFFDPFGLFKKH